jgi:hypothetical protein
MQARPAASGGPEPEMEHLVSTELFTPQVSDQFPRPCRPPSFPLPLSCPFPWTRTATTAKLMTKKIATNLIFKSLKVRKKQLGYQLIGIMKYF